MRAAVSPLEETVTKGRDVGEDRTSRLMHVRHWVIVAWLLATAMILHTTLFEWGWRDQPGMSRRPVLTWTHEEWSRTATLPAYTIESGLFRTSSWRREMATIVGVVLPLTLLAGATCLHLGWLSARRRAGGRCPNCRYVLRPQGHEVVERCPECNWQPGG